MASIFKEELNILNDIFGFDIYDGEYNDQTKLKLVKGEVQSGKSFFIILQTLTNFLNGVNTLILVRNINSDVYQLKNRFRSIINDINTKIQNKGYPKVKIPVYDLCKKTQTESNCIIISLTNKTRLNTFIRTNVKDYVLMIDEADYIDPLNESVKCEIIKDLKEGAKMIYKISATVTDINYQEKEITNNNVITLPLSSYYKNIKDLSWFDLDTFYIEEDTDKDILKKLNNDIHMEPFLKFISKKQPIYIKNYDNYHPNIILINYSKRIYYMYTLQDYIKTTYNDTFVTIVYNGCGIQLYIGDYKGPIYIYNSLTKKKLMFSPNRNNYYYIKEVSIADIIGFLKEKGCEKYSRIIIISGLLASRGTSFISNDYGYCFNNNKLGWHLTGEYLKISKQLPQPELLQSLRLLGNIKDDISLVLYTTEEIKNDIIKSQVISNKLLNDTVDICKEHKINTSEAIMMTPLPTQIMIKRRVTRNIKNPLLNIINNENKDNTNKEEGEIYLINPTSLQGKSKIYFEYFIEILTKEKWYLKADICKQIGNKYNINPDLIANTTHPWHDINKKSKHYTLTNDETTEGLLFKQNKLYGFWSICYN